MTPASLQADFNNDGSADLAASAPLEDVGTTVDAGAVSVLYGPVIGLSSDTFTQDAAGLLAAPRQATASALRWRSASQPHDATAGVCLGGGWGDSY